MGTRRTPASQTTFAYSPREQFVPFHQRPQRWACIVAHRRAGKTVACVNELVLRALYTKKHNPQYGYVAPFRQQAKNIAWRYLKDAVSDFAIEVRESDLSVTLPNHARISLYGSDNPDALRGLYFDGLIVDEFGDTRPSLWAEVLLPTLADRKGWCVVIGTPKGRNQFYDFYEKSRQSEEWFSLTLKADTSGIIDPEELAALKSQMSDAQYDQEMLCSFTAALQGTYYATLINQIEQQNHISDKVKHDPEFPVSVAADIGYSDSTVMFFWQERPDGIAVIDCEAANGKPLPYYMDVLQSKPYRYDNIWLPHDAKAKSLQTGKSTIEQVLAFYPKITHIAPQLSVQHGIEATRLILPYTWFNKPRCEIAIEALRVYRRQYNEKTRQYSDTPLHDWASDYADAARYMALCANKKKLDPPAPHESIAHIPDYHPSFKLEQLYAERQKNKSPNRTLRMRI